MINEFIISRLDELIGEYDTPFFNYLLYSYSLTLNECELIISKIKNDIRDDVISSDDNLVEVVERYFQNRCIETEKREKLEYLASLMDEKSDFYTKFLSKYEVTSNDLDAIYAKVESRISEDNISDFEIKRSLEYYFSNAVKQTSYIRNLDGIVGRNYDTLIIRNAKRDYPNIHDGDIYRIVNELHSEILDGVNFSSIKGAFRDKVMRMSESKKAEAIIKWDNLVLGNGDSFNKLLETKSLSIEDGENIKQMVRSRILKGLICADRIDGVFLTRMCIKYQSG